ncbi:MAG: CDP-alcohol phosphatidyltransferase family protein [Ignavibacteria bacterium]|nr:CDP-alcohol phosphatidyltransferase family protein [Ignavibacteria bacterium]
MISLYQIKPKFQQLLKPVLTALYKLGVTANMITWWAILLSLATGIIIWIHPYGKAFLILPLALLLRMALNALDGMMARTYNMQSKSGEILNELGDVVSDLCIFFPLLKLFSLNIYVLLGFLFLSVINEYTGILAKAVSGTRRYDGPMGKSDRAFIVGLISLILYFNKTLLDHLNIVFIFCIALLIISTCVRIFKTLKTK